MRLAAQQNATATLTGSVIDAAGGAVRDASIAVRSESSGGQTVKAITDQGGRFSVMGLSANMLTTIEI